MPEFLQDPPALGNRYLDHRPLCALPARRAYAQDPAPAPHRHGGDRARTAAPPGW